MGLVQRGGWGGPIWQSVLSPRYKNAVFVVLLGLVVALASALVMTLRVHELNRGFVDAWMRSALICMAVGVPVALLLGGPLRKAAEWVCR